MPITYYIGSRGGKYRFNEKGQKVYVSKGNERKKPKKTSPAKPTWGDKASFEALARLKQPNEKFLDNTVRRRRRSTRASKKDNPYSPRSSRSSRSSSNASSSISSPPSGKTHKKRLQRAKNIGEHARKYGARQSKIWQASRWNRPVDEILSELAVIDKARWDAGPAFRLLPAYRIGPQWRAITRDVVARKGRPVRWIKRQDGVRRPQFRRGKVVPPPESIISRSRFLPFGWIIDENGRTIPIPELLSKTPSNSTEERKRRNILSSAIADGRIRIISPVGLAPHALNRGKYRRILTGPTLQDFFSQQGLVGHLGPTKFLISDYLKERPNMSEVLMLER